MEIQEYLDQVKGQIRNKKARELTANELQAHIEDQAAAYENSGCSPEEAALMAVKEMGDPVQVGMELDRLHRPQFPTGMVCFIMLISLISIMVQDTCSICFSRHRLYAGDLFSGLYDCRKIWKSHCKRFSGSIDYRLEMQPPDDKRSFQMDSDRTGSHGWKCPGAALSASFWRHSVCVSGAEVQMYLQDIDLDAAAGIVGTSDACIIHGSDHVAG